MKYQWELEDIKSGMYVSKRNLLTRESHSPEDNAHYVFKICYAEGSDKHEEKRWFLIAITDGAKSTQLSKKEILRFFNNTRIEPISHDEIVACIDSMRKINEGR